MIYAFPAAYCRRGRPNSSLYTKAYTMNLRSLSFLFLGLFMFALGCDGGAKTTVIEAPPQSQAEVDAYEAQMNAPQQYEK